VLYLAVAGFLAVTGAPLLSGSVAAPHAAASAWIGALACALLMAMAHRAARSRDGARRLALTVGVAGLAVAVVALLQWALGLGPGLGLLSDPFGGATSGPFNNRNTFAAFLLLAGAPWLAAMRTAAGGRRLAVAAAWVVCAAALVASGSRAGLVALSLTAMLATVGVTAPVRRRVIASAVILIVAVALVWTPAADRVAERVGSLATPAAEVSVSKRAWIWADALTMVAERPLLGVGIGGFGVAFAAHRTQPDAHVTLHAHSEPLEMLVETGLIGTALAAAFVALLFRALLAALPLSSGRRREWVLAGLLGWLGLFAFALVDLPTVSPAVNYALAVLAGLGLGAADQRPTAPAIAPSSAPSTGGAKT
jgi:O-antigen ligase